MSRFTFACLLLCASGGATIAEARAARGRVVHFTATDAYITIGSAVGLAVGNKVKLHLPDRSRIELEVADVWRKGARLLLQPGQRMPRIGTPVTVKLSPSAQKRRTSRVRRLPPPESTAMADASWENVALKKRKKLRYRPTPSDPDDDRPRRTRGSLRLEYLGSFNLGSAPREDYHRIGLWSSLDYVGARDSSFDYSHRLRARVFLSRDLDSRRFGASRSELSIYRLRFGLNYRRFRAELGRMSSAPLSGAPTIDGATVRARLTRGIYFGAYGGMAPRPTDLKPSFKSPSFGVYGSLRLAGRRSRWMFSSDVGFLGSMFDGQGDRKALSAKLLLESRTFTLYGRAELDFLADNRPAGLSSTELSAATAQVSFRPISRLDFNLRFDRYRLTPTLEMLAFWGNDYVLEKPVTSARGGVDIHLTADFTLAASAGWERQEKSWTFWGDLLAEKRSVFFPADQLFASVAVNRGSLLDGISARFGYWIPVFSVASFDASYGLSRDADETKSTNWRHMASIGAAVTIARRWVLGADAAAMLSSDERVVQVFSTLATSF